MPRRESVLTLASEGFSEQSCVTNSSLSIIQNSCRIGRERQSDQHKLVCHSRADIFKSSGQNQTVWLEVFVCQNCSSWRYWLFICKITAIIWIEKIFLWKLKRKVGLPQIIMANVLECLTNVLRTLANHSEKKSSLSANFSWYLTWCSDYFYHGFNEFNGSCPARCKTKTGKTPCVGCKMSLTSHWCCACLKILKQAWIFSVSYIITLQGLCIHRKAINKNKHQSSGWYPTTGKTSTCKAKRFIPVYRLGEDGDLLQRRWWYAFGLGVKSSLL